jgi:hypothetical protein
MDPFHQKIVEITVQFLQFITSIFVILLSATGAAFFYYYTNKLKGSRVKLLWPLAVPTGIMLVAFIVIWIAYKSLIDWLAEGIISKYVTFWYSNLQWMLEAILILSLLTLFGAFILVHKKTKGIS